jgi:isocitrate lyase
LNHKEPSEKNTRDARDIIAELMSVVSEETAKAFVDHRKAKRAKLTWYAANLIAKKLSGHGNPDAVLLASIENGWTGVFPEKQQSKGQQGGHSKGERKLQSWLAGSSVAPRVDSWTDTDPSQPLLARR